MLLLIAAFKKSLKFVKFKNLHSILLYEKVIYVIGGSSHAVRADSKSTSR